MIDRSSSPWTRIAALLCFAVAGGLLIATLTSPKVKAEAAIGPYSAQTLALLPAQD